MREVKEIRMIPMYIISSPKYLLNAYYVAGAVICWERNSEPNRQSHALMEQDCVIHKNKQTNKRLYMHELCLEGNTTNWQYWSISRGTR